VADAWPTRPAAVLLEDHFAYKGDRDELLPGVRKTGGEVDVDAIKASLAAGLRLTDVGRARLEGTMSPAEVERYVADPENKVQDVERASAPGKAYEYVTAPTSGGETTTG
jgi:hypothetical protein